MFSIKDDLMASPKVIFFISVLLAQPQRLCIPFSHNSSALPFIHLTRPLSPPQPQRSTHPTPASGSANDHGEQRFQTETSTPDHPKLEPFPPWKQSVAANARQTHFLNYVRFFLKPFIPIYVCVCVHRVCTVVPVCTDAHKSLSSINILYVRAVNTPWSCVYVFFKVSYPQCYVNNSIYWLMKLCVDLYPPDIVYVALFSNKVQNYHQQVLLSSLFCVEHSALTHRNLTLKIYAVFSYSNSMENFTWCFRDFILLVRPVRVVNKR